MFCLEILLTSGHIDDCGCAEGGILEEGKVVIGNDVHLSDKSHWVSQKFSGDISGVGSTLVTSSSLLKQLIIF